MEGFDVDTGLSQALKALAGERQPPSCPGRKDPGLYFLGVKPVQSDLQLVRE